MTDVFETNEKTPLLEKSANDEENIKAVVKKKRKQNVSDERLAELKAIRLESLKKARDASKAKRIKKKELENLKLDKELTDVKKSMEKTTDKEPTELERVKAEVAEMRALLKSRDAPPVVKKEKVRPPTPPPKPLEVQKKILASSRRRRK